MCIYRVIIWVYAVIFSESFSTGSLQCWFGSVTLDQHQHSECVLHYYFAMIPSDLAVVRLPINEQWYVHKYSDIMLLLPFPPSVREMFYVITLTPRGEFEGSAFGFVCLSVSVT